MSTESPDKCLFKAHLEGAPFVAGVDDGRWGIAGGEELKEWPFCRMWVQVDSRYTARQPLGLRFRVDNYPALAPTAQPWNNESNAPLVPSDWPRGPRNVSSVFNPGWNATALYAPCDRVAMAGHDAWRQVHPQWWWTPNHTIVEYLTFVFRVLNPVRHE